MRQDSFPVVSFLVSYEYWAPRITEILQGIERSRYRLMIDSGAFTAWKQGKVIKLDEYARFLDSLSPFKPFHAIQLDVVGNEKQTRENFFELKKMGFDVMPVFTRGSSRQWLEECYDHTDYVLLGGVASGKGRFEYVDYFESINARRKQHWLGVDKIDLIKLYRPYSVDASNFQMDAKARGKLSLYSGAGQLKVFRKEDFVSAPPAHFARYLRLIGFDSTILQYLKTRQAWVHRTSGFRAASIREMFENGSNCHIVLSIISYVKRAIEIEKKLGTVMYLSARHGEDIDVSIKAVEHLYGTPDSA